MKKIIAILLSVLFIASLFPIHAFAESYNGTCGGNLIWSFDSDTGILTISGSGDMKNFSSSPTPWYSLRSSISTVNISIGVKSIGDCAFRNCTKLTSITIPDSVTSIGSWAFEGCTGLTSITIPNSVTYIGTDAFYGCTGLTSITIPNSVTYIRTDTFYGCTGLTSITIPNSVTYIGTDAFYGCTGLTSITISDSITSMPNYPFKNCKIKELNIAEGSKKVKSRMVMCRDTLEKVIIPNSVTSIDTYAFSDCTELTSITIPDSVTSIGSDAFKGCTGLTSIKIPDSITSIDKYVFRDCTGLTSITIPGSITSIDKYAFSGCENIDTVYYGGTETQWSKLSNKPNCKNVVYCNKIGIKVTKLPSKINYTEGENLSLYGGEVSVLYNNDIYDKSTALNSSTVKVTGFDTTKPGKQTLTVEYLGYTTAFDVNVIEKPENKTEFAGGKGVEHNPYLVSDKTQLNNVRKYPDAYFKQTKDIEFTAADFATGGMFYNNGIGWIPLGKDSSAKFSGGYDGGGFSIKNLKVSITTDNSAYGGLFGYCTGDLSNIKLVNPSISVTAKATAYAGGAAGYASGNLSGITVEGGSVSAACEKTAYSGGIAGYYENGIIDNCKNTAVIQGSIAGGIAGCAYGAKQIKGCSNGGSITGGKSGGIAGSIYTRSKSMTSVPDSDVDIIDCSNSGSIGKTGLCGGIVGYHSQGNLIIRRCVNSGEVNAVGTDVVNTWLGNYAAAGGMAGDSANCSLYDCKNTASIYSDFSGGMVGYGRVWAVNTENSGNISGRTYVGGIVGYHYEGTVESSLNTGTVTGGFSKGSTFNKENTSVIGGIIGKTYKGSGIINCRNTGEIKNGYYSGGIMGTGTYAAECYNTGKVTALNYAGGICADFYKDVNNNHISDCFNTGNITGKYAAGIIANLANGRIEASYNIGKIKSTDTEGYFGAICAYQTGGTVKSCYFLNNTDKGIDYIDYTVSETPQVTKLTDDDMKKASSFVGFDFDKLWTMAGHNEYLYPKLKKTDMLYIAYVTGDLDGDEKITDKDAIYLLMHSYFPEDYPVNQPLDYNNDGLINDKDAIYLLMHCYFPEDYPITK